MWAYPFKQYTQEPKAPRLAEIVHCTSCLKSQPNRFDIGAGWGSPLKMDFPEKVYQIANPQPTSK